MKITLPDFSAARVLIIGDVMLDKYWHGHSKRISPEAPVPVVHVRNDELRAGGASNVALNITALGAHSELLGLTGDDENAASLKSLLTDKQVNCHFLQYPDHDTSLKLRVIAQHQQMIRLDFEDDFSVIDKTGLLDCYTSLLQNCDIVILSDYGKGTLSDPQPLIQAANNAGKPVIIDPKGTDFSKYRGATLITPNQSEFEAVVGACRNEAELLEKAETLRHNLQLNALLVTRGDEGMTLVQQEQSPLHLPTYAREVFDVTGAGDTVIGVLAAALAAGKDLQNAVAIANLAAGLVVRKLGTATTSLAEIHLALQDQNTVDFGIVNEEELKQVLTVARHKGERIVMTNGCFDILHAGHIHYLQKARELGDRLLVAVNTDESVRQLKGSTRPVNSLANRMTLLAALKSVDWVVAFAEETPERLCCEVLPDILVKGGDYQPEEIAGGNCVRRNGGDVCTIAFVDGHSTTSIIDKISRHLN